MGLFGRQDLYKLAIICSLACACASDSRQIVDLSNIRETQIEGSYSKEFRALGNSDEFEGDFRVKQVYPAKGLISQYESLFNKLKWERRPVLRIQGEQGKWRFCQIGCQERAEHLYEYYDAWVSPDKEWMFYLVIRYRSKASLHDDSNTFKTSNEIASIYYHAGEFHPLSGKIREDVKRIVVNRSSEASFREGDDGIIASYESTSGDSPKTIFRYVDRQLRKLGAFYYGEANIAVDYMYDPDTSYENHYDSIWTNKTRGWTAHLTIQDNTTGLMSGKPNTTRTVWIVVRGGDQKIFP